MPKPTIDGVKKYRPCINLKPLNYHVAKEKFSFETVKSVKQEIQRDDWAASIDMTDAYFHVPVSSFSSKLLRFIFEGVIYEFVVLPFGLTCRQV